LRRIFFQTLAASFAAGYEKCFIYAADHPTLGFYDNTGTPPPGEPADWYFKAPNNTARGATALAQAIAALTAGEMVARGVGDAGMLTAATASHPGPETQPERMFALGLGAIGWIIRRRQARLREQAC